MTIDKAVVNTINRKKYRVVLKNLLTFGTIFIHNKDDACRPKVSKKSC